MVQLPKQERRGTSSLADGLMRLGQPDHFQSLNRRNTLKRIAGQQLEDSLDPVNHLTCHFAPFFIFRSVMLLGCIDITVAEGRSNQIYVTGFFI